MDNFTGMKKCSDGTKAWYKDGQLHCADGPALVRANGDELWYKNGKLHRIGEPAIEWADGYKEWYKNGKLIK